MRTENEIIKNVLDVAEARENIRAVIRTDLFLQREYLYSYQFCFIVNDLSEYEDDEAFKTCFGDRILLFRGDRNYPEMFRNTKAHLMVYRDGITIVINAMDSATFLQKYNGDETHDNVWIGETYQKLLDKDNLLSEIERLTETQTIFASAPTESEFNGTCNEFWWVLKTFAEYTLREELPSAMFYLNVAVRDLLNKMVSWYLYLRDGEPVDVGILNCRFEELLEEDLFLLYKKTYPDADYEHMWQAYTAVTELWNRLGRAVAEKRGFPYPKETEKNMLEFIRELRRPR